MDVICLDLEASGLGDDSYPIEVAWKNSADGDNDSFLINPDSVLAGFIGMNVRRKFMVSAAPS